MVSLSEWLTTLRERPAEVDDPAAPMFALARLETANFDQADFESLLDEMAERVAARATGKPATDARILAAVVFDEYGFAGNTVDYYDPRNSYFDKVLSRRLGIPISLSLVAMSVGRRAGLSVHGVGLPGHFIAAVDAEDAAPVFFDPFHGGRIVEEDDCRLLVETTAPGCEWSPDLLRPASMREIFARVVHNLKQNYLRRADHGRAHRMAECLCTLLPCDPAQRRDLGMLAFLAGKPGEAYATLSNYLRQGGDDPEAARVRGLARAELARWN